MPSSGNYNTSALGLTVATQPRTNWDARRQQKQAELQYANIQQSMARQERVELQAGIQEQIATIQQIKALPAEAPDRPLIDGFVNNEIKQAMKRIETDYQGDYRKFIEVEGRAFVEQMKSNFLSSPVYQRVERNKVEMNLARNAMKDNLSLIGTVDPATGKYISADEQIQMFNEGKAPGFTFRGAYDPKKVNAYEYFGKTYNPTGSKFERAPVSEEDKASYAQSQLGQQAGLDYYFQSLRNSRLYYKTDPIEEKTMFDLDVRDKKMDIAQAQSQINKNNAEAAKDLAEANGKKVDTTPKSYIQKTFDTALTNNKLAQFNPQSPNISKTIPGLGIRIADIATVENGQPVINMRKYPNSEASEVASESIGVTEKLVKGKKRFIGQLPGILDASNGVDYLDLSNVKHSIRKSDPYIYVDGKEEEARISDSGRTPKRAWKYYEVIVRKDDAKNLKLDPARLRTVTSTDDAGNQKSSDVYVFKGYVPVTSFVTDKNIDQRLSKQQQGQKQANEIFDATTVNQPEIFEW